MPETSTLTHFVLLGQCASVIAIVLGYLLNKLRLPYLAGLLCGVTVGASVVVSLFLEEGLSYPPGRDWHHIMWVMFVTSLIVGIIQIGRWQAAFDAMLAGLAVGIASQYLIPVIGSDELFDEHRVFWLTVPVLATAINIFLLSIKSQDSAAAWGLWLLVAQLAVISVALMLSYATLAGVALGVTAIAASVAAAMTVLRVWGRESGKKRSVEQDVMAPAGSSAQTIWLNRAIVPIGLAATLLTICVRTYSYGATAGWLYMPMLFLPTIVFVVDTLMFSKLHVGWRAFVAASLTTAISTAAVVYMVTTSGPSY